MKSPMVIEFVSDCLQVLRDTLLAVSPNEGCALLLGKQKQSSCLKKENILQIQMIWPCCNVWGEEILSLLESTNNRKIDLRENLDLSKENRFIIDPREQFLAQHWARKRNWEIVGSAHSHPNGNPIPSSVDRNWNFTPGLMVIVGQFGGMRAWWMSGDPTFHPKEVAIWAPK